MCENGTSCNILISDLLLFFGGWGKDVFNGKGGLEDSVVVVLDDGFEKTCIVLLYLTRGHDCFIGFGL